MFDVASPVSDTPPAALVLETAQPPDLPNGLISYPSDFFRDAAPTTALDMVLRLPGFTFDKGTAIRGLAGATGNVIVDGAAPVSKNDALDEVLKRIPANTVLRIEVIRGHAPGIDMQGRTVLANVVRRSENGFRGAVTGSGLFVADGRTEPGLRLEGQWRWGQRRAELSFIGGRGIEETLAPGPRVRWAPDGRVLILSDVDSAGEGTREWLTGAYETPVLNGKLRINGAYQLSPYNAKTLDRLRYPGGREYEYMNQDRAQQEIGARFVRPLTMRLSLEVIGFQQWKLNDNRARFEGPGVERLFHLARETSESVGRLVVRHRVMDDVLGEFGVEGAINRLESDTDLVLNGRETLVPAADVRVRETRGEVFGLYTWQATPQISLEGGLRQERSSISSVGDVVVSNELNFTKPRLGFVWAATPDRQVRLRVEREVGQLNFDDFVASSSLVNTGVISSGNPDLTPQQSWVSEAALEQRFWKQGVVVLTLRHAALSDVIDRAPLIARDGTVADAPGNIGGGRKTEAVVSLTTPLNAVGLKGGVFKAQATWRRTSVEDPTTGRKREISAARPFEWEAHLTHDLPRLRTIWGIDALGGYRESYYRLSEVETRKFDTCVTLFGEYKVRPDFSVRLELQNLTERSYQRTREVYSGPRDRAGLAYVDARDLRLGRVIYLRFRKTLGGN